MIKLYTLFLGKQRPIGIFVLLLCLTTAAYAAPMNGNYTINKSIASSSTNFTSFQALFTALSSNGVDGPVIVNVSNGPYTQQVSANAIGGVSSTNTITINGNGQTLNFNATSTAARHTLLMNGADWVKINNLTIEALGATFAWGVRLTNNSDYITFEGCTVNVPNVTSTSSLNSVCITATASTTSIQSTGDNCKNLTVQNCTLTGGTSFGPYFAMCLYAQSSEATVSNIVIKNNVIKNFYVYGNYFYRCNDLLFEGNEIKRDPNYTRISTTYGVFVTQCQNTKLRNNDIHDLFAGVTSSTNTTYNIFYSGNTNSTTQHEVSNNRIYNSNSLSTWAGIYVSCTYNVDISHNTISHTANPFFGTQYGVFFNCSYSGRSVRNNIIYLDMPGTSFRYGIYNGTTTTMNINRNNIYVTGTNGNVGFYNGDQKTPAAWQAVTGPGAPYDANSTFISPNLVSTTVGSQLIPRAVALDDLGTPIAGISTDYSGAPRSLTAPDPGATEFTIDANVTRVSTTGGNLACQGETDPVSVWIKNNAGFTIDNFTVTYTSTGANPVSITEPFVGSIPSGDSAQHNFATPLTLTNTGNDNINAFIGNKPPIGNYNIAINPSPIGAEITKGSPFQGQFYTGNNTDPDILANPDQLTYEVTAPTGYDKKDYGITWSINTFITKTLKNAIIPAGNITTTNANSSNNYKILVKPGIGLTDDTLVIQLAAYSLTTLCEAPMLERNIFVAPRPKADFSHINVCEKEAVTLQSTSTISSGTIKYDWDFGDGTSSDFADNNKIYGTYGNYTVKLTVTSNYGYTDNITKTVTVHQSPIVDFSYDNKCEGDAVPFTDNSVIPSGGAVYHWDFGDGVGTSSSTNPSYTYTTPKLYHPSLTITDANKCVTTLSQPVTYSANPKADFILPALSCSQTPLQLTNTSIPAGNTGYSWDYGNGQPSNTKDGSTSYAAAGSYTVTLTAQNDFGCSNVKTQSITITEAPVASFTINGKCIGEPITITNTTNEPGTVGYQWQLGEDGANSTDKNPSYIYKSVGDYTITLTASSTNGCSTSSSQTVTFGEKPIVAFASSEKACEGEDVLLTNNTVVSQGTLTYDWNLGNGNSTATNPTANYTTAGNYTISLTATSGIGCTASATRSITINATPNSNFALESSKTGNGGIELTPIAPGGTGDYTWLYGDGGKSTNKNKHTYTYNGQIGLFNVTLIINNDGCESNTSKEVRINVLSTQDITNSNINIYPNPSNGWVNVDLNGLEGAKKIQVMDVAGRLITSLAVNSAQTNYTLDMGNTNAGVYFVQIITDGGSYNNKITIVK